MVRIALISDIHFGKLSRSDEFSVPGDPPSGKVVGAKSLKDSLVTVLKNNDVKYIFIAGDLTSTGSPQEFFYCEKIVLSIAQEANIPKDHIIIGLGNHDIDWKISKIYEEYKSLAAEPSFPIGLIKESYQLIAANAARHNISNLFQPDNNSPIPFCGVVENSDFIVYILNSGWCCSHDQPFSHGKLGIDQLSIFESTMAQYRDDKRWKVILTHHHPYNYSFHIPGVDISTLEEGSQLIDIAGKNGVNLILHGHRHHPKAETVFKNEWKNPITFLCAGSLAVNAAHRSNGDIPNTLHIIELDQEPGILSLFNYQYSSANGWIPLAKNCPETPMDFQMKFGKLCTPEETRDLILKYANDERLIGYDDLDDCLRFLSLNELNQQFEEYLSSTHKIVGQFPKEVCLIKK